MKLLRYFLSFLVLTAVFTACEEEDNNNVGKGESINEFKLTGPSNFSSIVLNPGATTQSVVVTWEAAKTGKGGTPTYRVLLDKKGGDFSSPLLATEADGDGASTTATVSVTDLIDAIDGAGTEEFIWTVEAMTSDELGENKKSAAPFNIVLQVSDVAISAFELTSPTANQKISLDKIRTPDEEVAFTWTAATSPDGPVTYTFLAATTPESFDEPVIELPSDNDGTGTALTLTHGELTDLLKDITYVDGLYWRVDAVVNDVSASSESRFAWFDIFDIPNLYVVGSFTNGWSNNCTDAISLTNKGGGVFESILNIPAGGMFKFVLNCGSWETTWGNVNENAVTLATDYDMYSPGQNVHIAAAGNYFVRADFNTGKFRITEFTPPANMYLVGGAIPNVNWNPSASVPFKKTAEGQFEIYSEVLDSDGFKFLQVKDWAGDWGKGAEGKLVQEGESNVEVDADGYYRVTLDFMTSSYTVTKTTWGVIGSATPGAWSTDTDMTYTGDNTWEVDVTLTAGEFKFRANDDWAINMGAGGGNTLVSGAGNIASPGAGDYHIEIRLDSEDGYTYSITPL